MVVPFSCPSLETVKQVLAIIVQHVYCEQDVVQSAFRQLSLLLCNNNNNSSSSKQGKMIKTSSCSPPQPMAPPSVICAEPSETVVTVVASRRVGAGPVVEVSAVTSSISTSRPSSFKSQHHQRAAANSNTTPLPSSTTSSNPSAATSVTGASGSSHQHATAMETVGTTAAAAAAAAALGSTVGSINDDIIKADSYVVVQVEPNNSVRASDAAEPLLRRDRERIGDEEDGRRKSSSAGRKGLRHAASDPSARIGIEGSLSASLAKRRMDWRNSHHNYRSAPTTAGSREAQLISYDARRALRDPVASHQNHQLVQQQQQHRHQSLTGGVSNGNRRGQPLHLPKRCESMREAGDGAEKAIRLHQRVRCRYSPTQSPSPTRWRCHTVDCPCGEESNHPLTQNKTLLDEILAPHRHSFPCSDGGRSSRHQIKDGHQQHRLDGSKARSKELIYYNGDDLSAEESLDWDGFHPSSGGRVTDDDDGQSSIMDGHQTSPSSPAGPAPRITIRYNDPGSLESVNEDNLFFCLEAGSKNEFRQRMEKTIHAQYRQVWELRSNLESQSSECYEPSSPEPELHPMDIQMPVMSQAMDSFDSQLDINRTSNSVSFLKLSPEADSIVCDTPKNYMNSEDDVNGSQWNRRQSYQAVTARARHLLRQDSSPAGQPLSSFDSIDTIETSSTDRSSHLDQVTTSFESSATDSTTGVQESIAGEIEGNGTINSNNRMLQTIRGDSGYRSMESASTPRLSHTLAANLSLSQEDLDECQCENKMMHDEKCERNKPIVFARCTRYGLAKNRPLLSPSGPTATTAAAAGTIVTQQPPVHSSTSSAGWKHRVQRAQTTTINRDYSIDERTDALFREFSRCDPVYDSAKPTGLNTGRRAGDLRQTMMGRNRWISQQHNHYYPQQHRFLSLQTDQFMSADENGALNE